MRPVYCSAVVDKIEDGQWRVTVEGLAPHNETRTYDIATDTDEVAAHEGMDRFIEEMAALVQQ